MAVPPRRAAADLRTRQAQKFSHQSKLYTSRDPGNHHESASQDPTLLCKTCKFHEHELPSNLSSVLTSNCDWDLTALKALLGSSVAQDKRLNANRKAYRPNTRVVWHEHSLDQSAPPTQSKQTPSSVPSNESK
eukprot:g45095.t1